jgi:hypothetical protein
MYSFDMEIFNILGFFYEGYRVLWILENYVDWGEGAVALGSCGGTRVRLCGVTVPSVALPLGMAL